MARSLTFVAAAAILLSTFLATSNAFAGPSIHPGYWALGTNSTGYAFGSLTGGNYPTQVTQGHYAGHKSNWCPSDPSASWPYGTHISNFSPQPTYKDGNNNTVTYFHMYLQDIGDPACNQSDYWVDFYFGRYKFNVAPCSCNNGTEFCINVGSMFVNNCSDAVSWGNQTQTYYKWN